MEKRKYVVEFDDDEWEEIEAMCFEGFHLESGEAFLREQWVALGHIALGKAQRIEDGVYGGCDIYDDESANSAWVDQLRGISAKVFSFFRSGDCQF